ncbi:tandem-95 repeat protein [Pedobacter sp. BS3]|uniref:Calx-beta domain-containing protein n=1 Tax=Pedobacter sp. BS3 TaxID=2567937 RepID=UPI0011ED0CB2|nr:Calx-beta domain-containing protein [Pedobacter sp. BS3]TZF81845.1 tandem-95 repeat protein [Pedobacter sp. BS3]
MSVLLGILRKKSLKAFFTGALCAGHCLVVWVLLCASNIALAEGSKEMAANGGHRAHFLSSATTTIYNPFPTWGRVYVYAKVGETLYLGSSAVGIGQGKINVTAPNNAFYTTSTLGKINDRTEEVNGPLPNVGGYSAYQITVGAGQEGIWQIEFVSPGEDPSDGDSKFTQPNSILANNNWTQISDTEFVTAFDVSVRNAANTAFISGRAYMNIFGGNLGDYSSLFKAKFKILTKDGYLYDVDNNGQAGYQFAFFVNNKGFRDVSANALYKSINTTSSPNIHDPRAADTPTDITHKIFFNTPSSDLPASAPMPGGNTWLLTTPPDLKVENLAFHGIEGTLNQAGVYPLGGYINFEMSQPGAYIINLDINQNGSFDDNVDVRLTGTATSGLNSVYWDGKNGQGTILHGAFTFSPGQIKVTLVGGEVHFPFMDVENNVNGIVITRTNGDGSPSDMVYWDDSDISATVSPSNPRKTSVNGLSSSLNGHKWGSTAYEDDAFGNEVGLDTWTYVMSSPLSPLMNIQLKKADLEIQSVDPDKTTYCVGEQVTYTVKVKNNGPDDVTGAKFIFDYPAQLTVTTLNHTTNSGTTSISSTANSGSQFTALLSMTNGAELTLTLTGTITAYPGTATLATTASIMRPADVTDPDATNPDAAPPTDPQLECDSNPSGAGCNNIKSNSINISSVNLSIFAASATEGTGGTSNITFPVTLSGASNCDITVDYAITHGTTNAADFAGATSGTLTIPAGATSANIVIPITTDQVVEANETFTIALSNASGGNQIVAPSADGLINNDDSGGITITPSGGAEGGTDAYFKFSLPSGVTADKDIELDYVLNGTAIGTDYTIPVTGTVVIPAGTNMVTLPLGIINDDIVEGNETVSMSITQVRSPYYPTNITYDTPIAPELTITDDDTGTLTLSDPVTVTEGGAGTTVTADFKVTLDKATGDGFTISYATSDGTAKTSDLDYVAKGNILNFTGAANESYTIHITINGDDKIEPDELFNLAISGLTKNFGGRLTVVNPASSATIHNDDSGQVSITASDGEEGVSDVKFTFSFPPGMSSGTPTVISYTIDDISAGAALGNNVDYNASPSGSVTIPAGQNSVTLTLPVVDDNVIEGDENVKLTAAVSSALPGIQVSNSPQTAIIKDNDYAALTISSPTVTETEANTTAIFAVTLDKPTGGAFDVQYATSDGTATVADGDYEENHGLLHFNGTANEIKYITITIKGDKKIETDELFYVTLSSPSNTFGNRLTLPPPATGTILDDDSGAITITKVDGSETGPAAAKFLFSFPAGISSDQPVTIHYDFDLSAANAATPGTDYTDANAGTLTIPAGAGSATLTLPVIDDDIVEDTETITLTDATFISSAYPSAITLNTARPVANITDNDTATLTLTGPMAMSEGNSGNTLFTFNLTLDKTLQYAISIPYATSDGTATIADNDYQDTHGTLTFSAAESKPITVYVNGDTQIEPDELFNLILGNPSDNFNGRLTVVNPATTGTIQNDDSADIIITKQDGTEDGQPAQFIFTLKNGMTVDANTTISYTLTGTATSDDYTGSPSGTITIPAGQNNATLSLPITDDNKVENTETINLTVNAVSSPYGLAIDVANSQTSLFIFDNDEAIITISPASGFEGHTVTSAMVFNVTLSKPVNHPFRLYYQTADGTATVADGDYQEAPSGAYIDFTGTNPGTETHTISISVNGDRKIEADEDFKVIIGPLTNDGTTDDTFGGLLTIPQNTATGIIQNDDSGVITITRTDGAEEGPVNGKFTFSFPPGVTSDQPTTINYTLDGTATGGGIDYTPQYTGSITIPANANSADLILTIIDDALVEGDETVTLNSVSLGSARSGISLNPAVPPVVTIADNDVATLTFTGPATITETNSGTTTATYTLKLDKAVPGGFSIQYATADGTATVADNDYVAATQTLGFSGTAGETQTISITINGDAKIEPNETFKLLLSNLSINSPSANGRLTVPVTALTTTIMNDDDGKITITKTDGTEGASDASFKFSLPPGTTLDRDITINYALTGTALSGTDYNVSAPSPLVLPAGANGVTLTLAVNNDNVIEDTETVNLSASVVNNIYGIDIDTGNSQQLLHIFDDDTGTITITPVSIPEDNAGTKNATFTVTLSNPTTAAFKVHYKTVDGTATTADNDYESVENDLDFSGAPGSLTRTIQVPITGDRKIEADEDFSVVLSLLNDGVTDYTFNNRLSIVGSPATGTIENDDSGQVTINGTDGAEGGANPVFTFKLPGGITADKPITITYTLGGTATGGGLDYTASDPASITIAPGQNSATLTLAVNDDDIIEDTETVILNDLAISSDYGNALNPVKTSVNISDNDAAHLILSDPVTESEGNSGTKFITFKLRLDKETSGQFSIKYHTGDGTATIADNDYIASGTVQLDFAGHAGEEKEIKIIINGDTQIEDNEDFYLILTDLSSDFNGRLLIPSSQTRGIISNDDSQNITITKVNGSEDGTNASFTFSLPTGVTSDSDIQIDYTLSGTATPGAANDYTVSLPTPVTLPAGQNSVTLTLNVNDDQRIEGTETVNIEANTRPNPHSITIINPIEALEVLDNDEGKLAISSVTDNEGPGGNTKTFTFDVTLDKATEKPFTVPYSTSDGTATTADNDYVAVNGILSFSGNANETRHISITVNGDNKIEDSETFNVILGALSNAFGGRLTIDNAIAIGTITNDDLGSISIAKTDGAEAGPVNGKFTFSFPPGVTSDKPVTITYALGGTAQGNGVDYTPSGATSITIPANANSADLILAVNDDNLVEQTETVTLVNPQLAAIYPGISLSNAALPQVAITDNDEARLVLSNPVITDEENSGQKTITYNLMLDKPVDGSFSVSYATSDNTATANEDYVTASGTLSFNGQANIPQTIPITIKGDTKIEADELINLDLDFAAGTDTYGGRLSIPVKHAVTTIRNDDFGQLTLTKVDGEEGVQDAAFIFSLPDDITTDQDILINYTLGGTAAVNDDYTGATTGTLKLEAGQNSVRLDLPVIDDNRVEDTETVSILATVSGNPYNIGLLNPSETLNIRDNDYAKITIADVSQAEGQSGTSVMKFQLKLDKATGQPFTVGYTTADMTATAGSDYVAVTAADNAVVSFNGEAGEIREISIIINGDTRIEPDETFRIVLGAISNTFGNRLTRTNSSATGTIENDDNGEISITAANGKEEGAVAGSFTFSLPSGITSDEPVIINYTLGGTAKANGTDYTGTTAGSVTIPAGQSSVTLTLPVIDDQVVESNETITLTSVSISSPDHDVTLGAARPNVIIEDNDEAHLVLIGPPPANEKNSGTTKLVFTVTLDKAIDGNFTIPYHTEDETATTADNDYQAAAGTLTFSGAANEVKEISVFINGDTKVESNETFKLILGSPDNTFNGHLMVDNTAVTYQILNDDAAAISITKQEGEEGVRDASFTFNMPPGIVSDAETIIHYTLGGTAKGTDIDYTGALSGSISIPAGASYATLTLPVIDDDIIEDTETIILTTGLVESPYGITVSTPSQTLNILDNDRGILTITPASIPETNAGVTYAGFEVKLNKATGVPFTIQYATADGTATTADNDYQPVTSGTLSFDGNADELRLIRIPVNGDTKIEADEGFSVNLTGPFPDFNGRLTLNTATVKGTIQNDDSGEITVTKTDGSETGPTQAAFVFSLPEGKTSDKPITITYQLGGTAVINDDYTDAHAGTLVLPAGQSSVQLDLPVIDDELVEGSETITLRVTGISSANTGITVNPLIPSVTITDNDVATLRIDGPISVAEGNAGTTVATFTVTLDKAVVGSPSVSYTTKDGTATVADGDYAPSTGVLQFEGKANEHKYISVTVNGDLKIENDEQFTVVLSNLQTSFNSQVIAENRLILSGSPATGIIQDDDTNADNKKITIVKTDGAEGGSEASFTFSFPPGISVDTDTELFFSLTGTASSADYTLPPGQQSVIIPAGENSKTLKVPIVDDQIIEGTETIILTTGVVSNTRYGDITVSNSPQTAAIADNDSGSLTITPADQDEGNSGTSTMTFNVKLDKETGKPFTIDYHTFNGTAATEDNDYLPASGKLSFNGVAGETRTIEVSIIGDRKIEPDETFNVQLDNLNPDFEGRLNIPVTPAIGTIRNDDNAVITITKTDGAEGGGPASFIFSFPAGYSADTETTISYTLGGTATAGADYTGSVSGVVTIPAGAESASMVLSVIDDELIENDETITIAATLNNTYSNITLSPDQTVATIADNDYATLTIDGPVRVTEGNTGTRTAEFTVSLDKNTGKSFTVSYTTKDGTATVADNDYTAVADKLTFAGNAGESHKIFVDIKGDTKIESEEFFEVLLTALSDNFNGRLSIVGSPARGIIEDDDNIAANKQITITKTDGSEDGANAVFTFSFPPGVTSDAQTDITYSLGGTATGRGTDYNGEISGVVTIPAGNNSQQLILPVKDDAIVEGDETVVLAAGQVSNSSYNGITITNPTVTLSIKDNDTGTLTISPAQINEGDTGTRTLSFNVTLSKETGLPFTVNYATADGTATVADKDYIAISDGKLDFSGKANEVQTINVTINGDKKIEADETLQVILGALSVNFDGRLTVSQPAATGTVINDDNLAITVTGTNGAEAGTVPGTFTFSFPTGMTSDAPTQIKYTLGGTATGGGTDYNAPVSGTVIIPAGDEKVVLTLPVIDDDIVEDDERITIDIPAGGIVSPHSDNMQVNQPLPEIKITDNDNAKLTLSAPVKLSEGDNGTTAFQYTLTLDSPTNTGFTVDYATSDGTAKADEDYRPASGTLSFSGTKGEMLPITVLVNGDLKIEGDEVFNITLSNLSKPFNNRLTIPVKTTTGTIINDDAAEITVTKVDGTEGGQNGSFIFSLPSGVTSDQPTVISYRLTGTATASDYTASPSASTITIPAEENSVTLHINVTDDDILEETETVVLTITKVDNPYNKITATAPVPVLNIYDNDQVQLSVSSPAPVKERNQGSQTVTFYVSLNKPTDKTFTINYSTEDGTATVADKDYEAKSGRLTFAGYAGESYPVSVQINGDLNIENDETFTLKLLNPIPDFAGNLIINDPGTATILNDDIPPVAVNDFMSTNEDTQAIFQVTGNDHDDDGSINVGTVTIIRYPVKGDVKANPDGTVTYIPNLNENGQDTFTYTVKDNTGLVSNEAEVTVTIIPVNDPPVANDDTFYVLKDSTIRANVATNDSDVDHDVLRFTVKDYPKHGTLAQFDSSDGTFIYVPDAGFSGVDIFTYTACDPSGLCDDATVILSVQPRVRVDLIPPDGIITEGDSINVTARLTEPLLEDVTVTLSYGGTAERDKDYMLTGNYTTIVIPAGETLTSQRVTLNSIKDYLREGDEVAEIRIAAVTPANFVIIGSGSDITIKDFYPEEKPVDDNTNPDIHPDPMMSPNGDGLGNEVFVIYNIERYPDNEVHLYNRWGNEVYTIKGYNNKDKSFNGIANTGLFANKSSGLVDGVYYFIIYTKTDKGTRMNKGYVIMKR